jgi:hypothetical protein
MGWPWESVRRVVVAMPRTDQRTWMLSRAEEDPRAARGFVVVEAPGPSGNKFARLSPHVAPSLESGQRSGTQSGAETPLPVRLSHRMSCRPIRSKGQ